MAPCLGWCAEGDGRKNGNFYATIQPYVPIELIDCVIACNFVFSLSALRLLPEPEEGGRKVRRVLAPPTGGARGPRVGAQNKPIC